MGSSVTGEAAPPGASPADPSGVPPRGPTTPDDAMAAAFRARSAVLAWGSPPRARRQQWAARFVHLARRDASALARLAIQTGGLCRRDVVADQRAAFRPYRTGWRRTPQVRSDKPPAARVVSSLNDDAAPLTHVFRGVLPALLNGDCVITAVQPHAVPMVAYLRELALEAGLPGDVWQQLEGQDRRLSWVLTEHTDASVTACCTPRSAPGSITRPGLFVVRKDAPLRPAVRDAVQTAFRTAGRHCTTTPVIAVHAHHYDRFLDLFAAEARELEERARRSPETVLSRLISDHQMDAVEAYVRRAVEENARVVVSGDALAFGRHAHGPVVLRQRHLDLIDAAHVPPGPVAVVAPFTAWSEVLWAARGTGRHVIVHTTSPLRQLAPQFAALRVDDLRLVRPTFTLRR
ncbi:aldehyde dehydrogenase family protein [Streptomyces sp. NPDC052676]|uniref:aldehyde dehydrogenase family protein n=1 Tax=Streptomyces sp. NPDC052676 TaxID=3154953 RepID=UPI003422B683